MTPRSTGPSPTSTRPSTTRSSSESEPRTISIDARGVDALLGLARVANEAWRAASEGSPLWHALGGVDAALGSRWWEADFEVAGSPEELEKELRLAKSRASACATLLSTAIPVLGVAFREALGIDLERRTELARKIGNVRIARDALEEVAR